MISGNEMNLGFGIKNEIKRRRPSKVFSLALGSWEDARAERQL
jgi:hypothetical protein